MAFPYLTKIPPDIYSLNSSPHFSSTPVIFRMAGVPIAGILELLGSIAQRQVEQEVTLVFGVTNEVEKLTSNIQAIQAVIDDAERKQMKDANVRQWLDKLKDVSYEIDDVVDEWNIALLKLQIKKSSKVCFFIPARYCLFRQIGVRRDIAIKIKDLNGRLDVIADERNRYAFQYFVQSSNEKSEQRMTASIINKLEVVGRGNDKEKLFNMLLSESSHGPNHCSIISVIGMGGIGKTTLAQLAYNDETICSHFQKRMWVCVSDPFDETRTAKAILEVLTGSTPNLNELNPLLESIRDHINGKKFVLVLDDVWCENYDWCRKLKDSLESCSPGSKILVTTRNERVADVVGSTKLFLGVLEDKECWDLFKRVILFNWTDEERENVEDIGHKIIEKCKGLPLAIKTIGGSLCMKKSRIEWLDVLESDSWKVAEERGVFPPLLLSYNDLSPTLRRCFLYCAVFPKDFVIGKHYIINLWMAQGYLGVKNNIEMEKVGDEYFSELAMRSFFQDFEKDGSTITGCKMHDIVHDFAQYLTKNECLAMEVDGVEERNFESSYANTRHLMMFFNKREDSIPISIGSLRRLRTLKINDFGGAGLDKVLDQLTSLKTLDLSGTGIEELPRKVRKLTHLRYLNLESCESLKELPENVCDLCNLLVLNVQWCTSLERLPRGLGKLINLRRLELRYSKIRFMPRVVDRLTCLRYLDEFVVSSESDKNEASTLSALENLKHLQELEISGLGEVREASGARKANLHNKKYLTQLALQFDPMEEEEERRTGDEKVLEALQPHPNLEFLEIYMYKGIMVSPNWMTNLKHLILNDCRNCEVMPPLGNLPSLEELEIYQMNSVKRVGNEFLGYGLSSSSPTIFFPKLKKLQFSWMDEWEVWDYNIDITSSISIMPCLTHLDIVWCGKLKALSDHIFHTPSLQNCRIQYSTILKEHLVQSRFRHGTPSGWKIISEEEEEERRTGEEETTV